MKFRKKPVVIEAFQNGYDVEPEWMKNRADVIRHLGEHSVAYEIKTLEGVMTAAFGDWVIKGVKGEIYPCRADIFEMTYEAVETLPTAEQYFGGFTGQDEGLE